MPPTKQETIEKPKSENLFVPIKEAQIRRGVKLFLWGEFGSGKTYTAMTFPGPIHAISTEYGVASLGHHFPTKDINIVECSVPFTDKPESASGDIDDQPFAIDPVISLQKLEAATMALKDKKEGTVIVDSVSDIWAWLGNWLDYIAKKNVSRTSGKEFMMRTEWQKANAKYRWLMMRLFSLPCHVVLTSRSGPVYDATGNITAQTKAKAQQETPYYADIVAKLEKKTVPNVDASGKITGQTTKRIATIEKCRYADINNLQITDLTFDKLKEALGSQVPDGVF